MRGAVETAAMDRCGVARYLRRGLIALLGKWVGRSFVGYFLLLCLPAGAIDGCGGYIGFFLLWERHGYDWVRLVGWIMSR